MNKPKAAKTNRIARVEIGKADYAKERVLVVDDEKFVSQPIVGMLTHLGFNADSANSGENALKALRD